VQFAPADGQGGLRAGQPLPCVLEPGGRARDLAVKIRIGARAGPLSRGCQLGEPGAQTVHAPLSRHD
jgi:hypothetical protein